MSQFTLPISSESIFSMKSFSLKEKKVSAQLQVCIYCFFSYKLSRFFPPSCGSSLPIALKCFVSAVWAERFFGKGRFLWLCFTFSPISFSLPARLHSPWAPFLRGWEELIHWTWDTVISFRVLNAKDHTEELYKKDLNDPDNHSGVITRLEPDILECEAKRALGSITMNKASGGDGIPVELWWCCESAVLNMPANLENSAVATGLEKVSFHSNPKERQCQRMFNDHTIALISHTKVMLKILHTRLQQYVNCELPGVQAGFRKGRGTRDQISNIRWIIEKAREF